MTNREYTLIEMCENLLKKYSDRFVKQSNDEEWINLMEKCSVEETINSPTKEPLGINRQDVDIPSWYDYFLGIAFDVAARSKDGQTHHGCVIVDKNNRIISTGYNSFPKNMRDGELPNLRPEPGEENNIWRNKYKWMKHSEKNALANCGSDLQNMEGVTAFISGRPCYECMSDLYSFNVKKIVYADTRGWQKDEEEKEQWDYFVKDTGMNVIAYKPDLNWRVRVDEKLRKLGFITD